jgi:hypothetical protein
MMEEGSNMLLILLRIVLGGIWGVIGGPKPKKALASNKRAGILFENC